MKRIQALHTEGKINLDDNALRLTKDFNEDANYLYRNKAKSAGLGSERSP